MPEAVVQSRSQGKPVESVALLDELQGTYAELGECLDQLQQLLDRPTPDLARLTTVRLRLARLRLSRGSLMEKISKRAAGKINASEQAVLQQMRLDHQKLLEVASAHTGKWTLDAVKTNWPEYRRTTREVARLWQKRAKTDQELLYPLVKK